ncbi:hypothetical protein D3C87_278700 [compost metagenome]
MTKNNTLKTSGKNTGKAKEQTFVRGHETIIVREGKEIRLWKGKEVGPDNHRRPRWGKTAKDRASGALARNTSNKDTRAGWMNDSKRSASTFPYSTCNGKRNRTVITGKGNSEIRLVYKVNGK